MVVQMSRVRPNRLICRYVEFGKWDNVKIDGNRIGHFYTSNFSSSYRSDHFDLRVFIFFFSGLLMCIHSEFMPFKMQCKLDNSSDLQVGCTI